MRVPEIIGLSFLIICGMAEGVRGENLATKNLARSEDHIVIKGELLGEMVGKKIANLRLFAFSGGKLAPIPYQIDELDSKGSFVFTHGEQKGEDEDKGLLDGNDELVFMAWDTGDRAAKNTWPDDAKGGLEIEITDPMTGTKAWAYLFFFEQPPAPSDRDYIRREQENERYLIESLNYNIGGPANTLYYDRWNIITPEGKKGPDLVDRLKIRARVKLKIGPAFNVALENLIKTRVVGWINGPVRVVVHGTGYLKFGMLKIPIKKGTGHANNFYYPNCFIMPTQLNIPFNLGMFLKEFRLYGDTDFNHNAYGWVYHDPQNWEGVILDGVMSEAETKLEKNFVHDWHYYTGKAGIYFHRIYFPMDWGLPMTRGLYYLDDKNLVDQPEDEPGRTEVGYDFGNTFVKLKKGSYIFYMHYYFLKGFEEGFEKKIMAIADNPLKIEVVEKMSANAR
jgi:hypothetical protein